MLSDDDVLRAVREEIERRGETSAVAVPGDADLTWHPLLEGEIVRCVEDRREERRFHAGPLDLSGRPEYETTIGLHPLPPPGDPRRERTWRLVRKGSADHRTCECGNGQVACPRCRGAGGIPCEPYRPCDACGGVESCLRCDGTGSPAAGTAEREDGDRVQCRECGARRAACPGCHGRGRLRCPVCQGAETRPCPDCAGDGTVEHRRCAGTGTTVEWQEGIIKRRPTVTPVRLPKSGVPYLARQQAREHGEWTPVRLSDDEPLPARLHQEFAPDLKELLRGNDGEIARTVTVRTTRIARVVVAEHPHRLYFVLPVPSGGPHVLVLPSCKRTAQLAAAALGALVLLLFLVHLVG